MSKRKSTPSSEAYIFMGTVVGFIIILPPIVLFGIGLYAGHAAGVVCNLFAKLVGAICNA